MKSEAVATKTETKPVHPFFVETKHAFEEMEKVFDSISKRAFDFFKGRNHEMGKEWDDWFRAESEFLRPATAEMTENDGALTVRLEVPGYAVEDIKISVEPMQAIIRGNVEKKEEKKEAEKVIYTEYRSNQIFRNFRLPQEVDPAKATAILKDGVLTLTMPKVLTETGTQVEIKTE